MSKVPVSTSKPQPLSDDALDAAAGGVQGSAAPNQGRTSSIAGSASPNNGVISSVTGSAAPNGGKTSPK